MGSLIDKLILLERWESIEETAPTAAIDVGRLVEDLVTPIADAHPDRSFAMRIAPRVFAAVDPTEFGYVVTNLTDNALKYGKGTIAVSVGAKDGSALVEVADEGPGIPSTDAQRVFDRFYRGTQRDVAGSGLGLSIVKRAVERAGGHIDLDTGPNGSRFIVSLPRS
jgi:signal transduction histidine kinase